MSPTEGLPNDPAPVKAWPAGRIAAAVSSMLWLFMILLGASIVEGVRDQHVAGYADDARDRLYVVTPVIGLAISGAIVGFAKRLPSWATRIGTAISFLALWVVLGAFGGGI